MKKTKLYLTAPIIGHHSEDLRHVIYDHVVSELLSVGYELSYIPSMADKVIIIGIPGWDSCNMVASDINQAFDSEVPVMLIGLEEVM